MLSESTSTENDLKFLTIKTPKDFPETIPRNNIEEFLLHALGQFGDPIEDIRRGVDYAMGIGDGRGGFITIALIGGKLVGALVMLETGMSGYIPANILLYVATSPNVRGRGIGRKLIAFSIEQCTGDVKLHVEYNNPAKRLYERIGFTTKYAEMRFSNEPADN